MEKARQVYLAVIRSAVSYGAVLWHRPGKKPKGPVTKLQKHQNSRLRQVLGAFRATPIRQLETEAYVPPLDLWLNGRVARFQAWLEKTGLVRQIRNACTAIKMQLRLQTRTRARTRNHQQAIDTPGTARKQWAENW